MPGKRQLTGTEDQLYLTMFSGEVLNVFRDKNIMMQKSRVMNVGPGKDFQFPKIGQADTAYHVKGQSILNGTDYLSDIEHTDTTIAVDKILLSSIFVDISGVAVGTQLTVNFLGKPVFIRRRTAEEIEAARAVSMDDLIDQTSENPKSAANWVLGDVSAALNKDGISVSDAALSAIDLAALIGRIDDNTLSSKMAKDVFDALWQGETNVDDIIDRKGLKQVSDSGALEVIIDALISENAAQVEQYRVADEGKQKKLIGFFVGQAMKASKGQANPQLLNQLLKEKLG